MKRSEKKRQLLEDLNRPGGLLQLPATVKVADLCCCGSAEEMANLILQKIDELGIARWDPEEPLLPERLEIDKFGDMVAPRQGIRTPYLTVIEKREAVRRYNAWPELRRQLEGVSPNSACHCFAKHLLGILGKE